MLISLSRVEERKAARTAALTLVKNLSNATVFSAVLFTAMILTFQLRKCSIILISLSCLLAGPTPRNYRHPRASRACHQEGSGGQVQIFGAPKLRVQVSDAAVVQRRDEGQLQVWSLTQFYSVDFVKFTDHGVKICVFNKRTIKVCVSVAHLTVS